jgi:UDP-glucuronate decarboxylase
LIEGFAKLMFSDSTVTGPINLGNPTEFTMLELAKNIIALTDSKSKISFHELPQDDPKQRKPDITKAKSILDWEPKISLSVGLTRTIEEFKTRV